MHEVPHSPGRLQRWCGLPLDGENRWGFARIQVDRFGVMHYRLVLYPPGINDVERRWLRIWRGAPVWGAVLWVLSEIFLQPAIGPGAAHAASTGTVLGLGAVALAKARNTRTKVRSIGVVTMPGYTNATIIAARDGLLAKAMTLTSADELVDEERMSPLDHEALWWRVYEELAPDGAIAGGRSTERG